MKPTMHIVFAGGGSVGHLMPGLAVAEVLRAQYGSRGSNLRITFAGSGKPLEERLVRAAGFEYLAIASRPLPQSVGQAWQFLRSHMAGRRAAWRYLRQHCVSAVVGLGGYASVPMAQAAVGNEISLVLLEQNVVPGKATRWLASRADAISLAFEPAQAKLHTTAKMFVTGTPVRPVLGSNLSEPASNKSHRRELAPLNLLVLGGSAGSRAINEAVPRAIYKSIRQGCRWQVLHQAGDGAVVQVRDLYRRFDIRATVSAFFDEVPQRLAATDLVISRAGGTSLAEIAYAAAPAILVPYERASDDHQRANAAWFQQQNAALVVDPAHGTESLADRLAETLIRCYQRAELRQHLAGNARELARPQAARQVAKLIAQVANTRLLATA